MGRLQDPIHGGHKDQMIGRSSHVLGRRSNKFS